MNEATFGVLTLLVVVAIVHSVVLLGLLRIVPDLVAASGRRVALTGEPAPEFHGADLSGAPINLGSLRGKLTALLFVSPSCQSCTTTLDEYLAVRDKVHGNVLLVCRGRADDCQAMARTYGSMARVAVDEDDAIGRAFGIRSIPSAVVIGPEGRILSHGQPARDGILAAMGPLTQPVGGS